MDLDELWLVDETPFRALTSLVALRLCWQASVSRPNHSKQVGRTRGRGPLHGGKGRHTPCKALRICLTTPFDHRTLNTGCKHHEHSEDGKEDEREFLHPESFFESKSR
jgi:hypothetical protein